MKKVDQDIISALLGVEPIMINSADFSAQNRVRLYWTNIPVAPWSGEGAPVLSDIIDHADDLTMVKQLPRDKNTGSEKHRDKSPTLSSSSWQTNNFIATPETPHVHRKKHPGRPKNNQQKAGCLTGAGGNAAGNHSDMDVLVYDYPIPTTATGRIDIHKSPSWRIDIHKSPSWRRFTPTECERLQTLPDGYTEGVSNTQRYKALGNGWTVDVIAHILRGIDT